MSDFIVHTAEQLPILIQAFRKQAGLTQADTALRLGVTQQTMSALERNAGKVSAERLLRLLGILGVELVLRKSDSRASGAQATRPGGVSSCPDW